MRLEHHLHVVGGYMRYISPHIIIIIEVVHVHVALRRDGWFILNVSTSVLEPMSV